MPGDELPWNWAEEQTGREGEENSLPRCTVPVCSIIPGRLGLSK